MLIVVTDIFIVGFVETTYTVIESDGQVEVCVNLISSEGDICSRRVLDMVFNNPGNNPDGTRAAASKLSLH